jgi:hypothetical protein
MADMERDRRILGTQPIELPPAHKPLQDALSKLAEPIEKQNPKDNLERAILRAQRVRHIESVLAQLDRFTFDSSVPLNDDSFLLAFKVLAQASGLAQKVGLDREEKLHAYASSLFDAFPPGLNNAGNKDFREQFLSLMCFVGLNYDQKKELKAAIPLKQLKDMAQAKVAALDKEADKIPGWADQAPEKKLEAAKALIVQEAQLAARAKFFAKYKESPQAKDDLAYLDLLVAFRDMASGNVFARRGVEFDALGAYSTLHAFLGQIDPRAASKLEDRHQLLNKSLGQRGTGKDAYLVTKNDLKNAGYIFSPPMDEAGERAQLSRSYVDDVYPIQLEPWPGRPPRGQTAIDVIQTHYAAMDRITRLDRVLFEKLCDIEEEREKQPEMTAETLKEKQRQAYDQTWAYSHEIKDDVDKVARQTVIRTLQFGIDDSKPLTARQLEAFALLQELHRQENSDLFRKRGEQEAETWQEGFVKYPTSEWIRQGLTGFAAAQGTSNLQLAEFIRANEGHKLSVDEISARYGADYQRAKEADDRLQQDLKGYQGLYTELELVGREAHKSFDVDFDKVLDLDNQKNYVPTDKYNLHLAKWWHEAASNVGSVIWDGLQASPEKFPGIITDFVNKNRDYLQFGRIVYALENFRAKYGKYIEQPKEEQEDAGQETKGGDAQTVRTVKKEAAKGNGQAHPGAQ